MISIMHPNFRTHSLITYLSESNSFVLLAIARETLLFCLIKHLTKYPNPKLNTPIVIKIYTESDESYIPNNLNDAKKVIPKYSPEKIVNKLTHRFVNNFPMTIVIAQTITQNIFILSSIPPLTLAAQIVMKKGCASSTAFFIIITRSYTTKHGEVSRRLSLRD